MFGFKSKNLRIVISIFLLFISCGGGDFVSFRIMNISFTKEIRVDTCSSHIGKVEVEIRPDSVIPYDCLPESIEVEIEIVDIDDPADDTVIDPNGLAGDDNGSPEDGLIVPYLTLHKSMEDAVNGVNVLSSLGVYKGRNIYWIPVYTAKMYMRAYPDYFGTYHPGDNFKITLRTETGHETTFVVFTVKTLHIEYDFMEDCVIRKSSWSIVNSIFSGEKNDFVRDPNKDTYIRLYYGSLNYLFPDDTIKEDISFPNRLNLSLYQAWNDTVRERILYTYRNYGYYNNSDTLYPVYVVSVDSVEDDPDGYAKPAGSTYWPWLDQNNPHPEDSLNMVSVIYIKWCENYCEYRGLDLSLYVGSVIAHELGHFICYLRDANFYTWEHTGPCIMNYDTLMTWVEDGKLPYFCSKCIYYLRKNPRSRGPVVFRRRQP